MLYRASWSTSSTRTSRGGSCLSFDYKTFFIYRTCMRRPPCGRALCELVLLISKNVTSSGHVLRLQLCFACMARKIIIANLLQPFQYDLRCPAAKDNSMTHTAVAPSNLDAATTMRSAETLLQNTLELRAKALEIAAPKPDLDAKGKETQFWSTF